MPKADKKKSQYKRAHYQQQYAEGKLNKGKGKGKEGLDDNDDGNSPKPAPMVFSQTIRAPGVLVNCVRGKEKRCGQELLTIFNQIAEELYPDAEGEELDDAQDESNKPEKSVEEQLKEELEDMKKQPVKVKYKFSFVQTKIECFLFITMRKGFDPNRIVEHYLETIERTGVTQSRFAQRLIPCQSVCSTDLDKVISTTKFLMDEFTSKMREEVGEEKQITWKLNCNSKTESKLSKNSIVAQAGLISPLKVAMGNADLVVGMEMYKGQVAIGIMRNYDRFRKYNPQELAVAYNKAKTIEAGRVNTTGEQTIPTEPTKSTGTIKPIEPASDAAQISKEAQAA